jgi:membrane protease YdiL (CAAX protease family)
MTDKEERKGAAYRLGFFVLFLLCGSLVFVVRNFLHDALLLAYLIGTSVAFLVLSIFIRRTEHLKHFFPVLFAFFIASLVSFLDDASGMLHLFSGTTIEGIVLGGLVSTVLIVVPIILLTRFSGLGLQALYLQRGRLWVGLGVGLVIFFILLVLLIINPQGASSLFPVNPNLTTGKVITLLPGVVVLVLLNGLREETWFRGLFLQKYQKFVGNGGANVLQAIIFSLAHFSVQYTPALLVFLLITFLLGLLWGFLIQKTNSLLIAILFHAAMDLPIILGILSNL